MIPTLFNLILRSTALVQPISFYKSFEMPYKVAEGEEITIELQGWDPYTLVVESAQFNISTMSLLVQLSEIEEEVSNIDYEHVKALLLQAGWEAEEE